MNSCHDIHTDCCTKGRIEYAANRQVSTEERESLVFGLITCHLPCYYLSIESTYPVGVGLRRKALARELGLLTPTGVRTCGGVLEGAVKAGASEDA